MAKRGRPRKKKVEAEAEVTGDASQEDKKEDKKKVPTDCRLCVNYPLQDKVATTSLSPELITVTKGFTRTFCGQAPAGGLNCRDKKFTPISK